MSTNLDGFNAEEQEGMRSFEAIPRGEYLAMVTESEMKPTKANDGSYLEFVWQIVDGEFKGRNLWSRLNLNNKNQQAVDIAKRELGDICKAARVLRPKDSGELHGIPIVLKVGVEKRSDNGELTNNIKGYAAAANAATAPAAPAPAAAKTPEKPPWA